MVRATNTTSPQHTSSPGDGRRREDGDSGLQRCSTALASTLSVKRRVAHRTAPGSSPRPDRPDGAAVVNGETCKSSSPSPSLPAEISPPKSPVPSHRRGEQLDELSDTDTSDDSSSSSSTSSSGSEDSSSSESDGEGSRESASRRDERPGPALKRTRSDRDTESSSDDEDEPRIEIMEDKSRFVTRFKTYFRESIIRVRGLKEGVPQKPWLTSLISTILKHFKAEAYAKDDDKVILEIDNADSSSEPVWIGLRKASQLSANVVLDQMERICQSNKGFLLSGPIRVNFINCSVPVPGEGARKPFVGEGIEGWCVRKKNSVTKIANKDSMCLARALVVARLILTKPDKKILRKFCSASSADQETEARHLCTSAGINPELPCGTEEILAFQAVMTTHSISVFGDTRGQKVLVHGPPSTLQHPREYIDLVWFNAHFNIVHKLLAAFDWAYVCRKCLHFGQTKGHHTCEGTCRRCLNPTGCDEPPNHAALIRCDKCSRFFNNAECKEFHETTLFYSRNRSVCDVLKYCTACNKSYSMRDWKEGQTHSCGEMYCGNCHSMVDGNHKCYIQPDKGKKAKEDVRHLFIFYDLETTQQDEMEGRRGVWEHRPNLLVAQQVCKDCEDTADKDFYCGSCGLRQRIFMGESCVGDFLDFLQDLCGQERTEVTLLAHFAKGFDSHFLLREITARGETPTIIANGLKIISIRHKNMHFKDSFCFLPMALAKIPKAFNLRSSLKKGWFPHLFHTRENMDYEGPVPAKEYFAPESMGVKEKTEFDSWYEEKQRKGETYIFRKELLEYCESDVSILREGAMVFRKEFIQHTGVDVLREATTIASGCMLVFRRRFLKPKTIAVIPPGGYRCADRYSHEALRWLEWEQHLLDDKGIILHAANSREQKVLNRKVDGYVEINGEKIIYQYHGCYFHGHKCQINRRAILLSDPTTDMASRYESTEVLTKLYRDAGYTVKEMWSCEFKELQRVRGDLTAFLNQHPATMLPPLDPRQAFYGGRTSVLKTYRESNEATNERIHLYDVRSLYPHVNKVGIYPVGHPEIFVGTDCPPLARLEGLVHCTVLPPRKLLHPVLPTKMHGKLLFILCRSCGMEMNQRDCTHDNPVDRELTGVWVSWELKLAVRCGYRITKIHEAWHYQKVSKYSRNGKSSLFSEYINCFVKLKQESSGWPAWCESEADKELYVKQFEEKEGIKLDPSKIEKNEAKRQVAKLCANSFWGRFGMRPDLTRSVLVNKYADHLEWISNPSVEVASIVPISDEVEHITWRPRVEDMESPPNTNVVIAAYTTAHARIQLYSYLQLLQERAMYNDTDSAVFYARPEDPMLPLGDFIGDLSDEITEGYGKNSYIVQFCSGGPKNYGYRVAVGGDKENIVTVLKVRGITMSYSSSEVVTFDQLKQMVLEDEQTTVHVDIPYKIVRLKGWRIATRAERKQWKTFITKRRRLGDYDTLPYGCLQD